MTFFGDHEGALWAIATGTSGGKDCENAEIMRGIAQEALGTAWTDYLNHQKGAKEAFGQVIPFSSEQPQTPAPQSSEGESTEVMVDAQVSKEEADATYRAAVRAGTLADDIDPDTWERPIGPKISMSNGTTHPEQQDEGHNG